LANCKASKKKCLAAKRRDFLGTPIGVHIVESDIGVIMYIKLYILLSSRIEVPPLWING
jgi:hypothetical protein